MTRFVFRSGATWRDDEKLALANKASKDAPSLTLRECDEPTVEDAPTYTYRVHLWAPDPKELLEPEPADGFAALQARLQAQGEYYGAAVETVKHVEALRGDAAAMAKLVGTDREAEQAFRCDKALCAYARRHELDADDHEKMLAHASDRLAATLLTAGNGTALARTERGRASLDGRAARIVLPGGASFAKIPELAYATACPRFAEESALESRCGLIRKVPLVASVERSVVGADVWEPAEGVIVTFQLVRPEGPTAVPLEGRRRAFISAAVDASDTVDGYNALAKYGGKRGAGEAYFATAGPPIASADVFTATVSTDAYGDAPILLAPSRMAGDVYRVRASAAGADAPVTTGTLCVWRRLRVQVLRKPAGRDATVDPELCGTKLGSIDLDGVAAAVARAYFIVETEPREMSKSEYDWAHAFALPYCVADDYNARALFAGNYGSPYLLNLHGLDHYEKARTSKDNELGASVSIIQRFTKWWDSPMADRAKLAQLYLERFMQGLTGGGDGALTLIHALCRDEVRDSREHPLRLGRWLRLSDAGEADDWYSDAGSKNTLLKLAAFAKMEDAKVPPSEVKGTKTGAKLELPVDNEIIEDEINIPLDNPVGALEVSVSSKTASGGGGATLPKVGSTSRIDLRPKEKGGAELGFAFPIQLKYGEEQLVATLGRAEDYATWSKPEWTVDVEFRVSYMQGETGAVAERPGPTLRLTPVVGAERGKATSLETTTTTTLGDLMEACARLVGFTVPDVKPSKPDYDGKGAYLPLRGSAFKVAALKRIDIEYLKADETWAEVTAMESEFAIMTYLGTSYPFRGAYVFYGEDLYPQMGKREAELDKEEQFYFNRDWSALHELGHCLHLIHQQTGDEDSSFLQDHDPADVCVMGYLKYGRDKAADLEADGQLCGRCLLRLRGWDMRRSDASDL